MAEIKHLLKSHLDDNGVSVSELLKLLNLEDNLTISLLESLDIKKYENDFIQISGANSLVQVQKGINQGYYKEDLACSLHDITVNNEEEFTLQFHNVDDSEYLSQLNLPYLTTRTKYSARNDFFSWYYGIDKYASELMKNGLDDILYQNIELLKESNIADQQRKYRILHDLNKNEFFVRAIISLDRYNNYDNNITILIALLSLHKRMQEEDITYSLNRVEYNESYMKIFFEEDSKKKLGELGYVKNVIQVSNDEVKREALKFEAISNIEFIDSENKQQEIIIQSSFSKRPKIKSNILAIAHSLSPDKLVEKLKEIDNSVKIHEDLFELINNISKIKDPLQIIHLIKELVKNARDESFKTHRSKIQKVIDTHVVDNMIQLLTLFSKMELITENDIEASEYVRYIIYQSLIEKKSTQ